MHDISMSAQAEVVSDSNRIADNVTAPSSLIFVAHAFVGCDCGGCLIVWGSSSGGETKARMLLELVAAGALIPPCKSKPPPGLVSGGGRLGIGEEVVMLAGGSASLQRNPPNIKAPVHPERKPFHSAGRRHSTFWLREIPTEYTSYTTRAISRSRARD